MNRDAQVFGNGDEGRLDCGRGEGGHEGVEGHEGEVHKSLFVEISIKAGPMCVVYRNLARTDLG